MPYLTSTLQTPLIPNPNFPDGYVVDPYRQTFDFTRNWFYRPCSHSGGVSGIGGIEVTDLSTMAVIKTPTLAQMYAGTPYGSPPGSPPPDNKAYDIVASENSDLYFLTDSNGGHIQPGLYCRFVRANPVTMKVTGEFYTSDTHPPPITCIMSAGTTTGGASVNKTATHTIVLFKANGSLGLGPYIM